MLLPLTETELQPRTRFGSWKGSRDELFPAPLKTLTRPRQGSSKPKSAANIAQGRSRRQVAPLKTMKRQRKTSRTPVSAANTPQEGSFLWNLLGFPSRFKVVFLTVLGLLVLLLCQYGIPDSLPVEQPAIIKAVKLTPAQPIGDLVETASPRRLRPIFGPKYYMRGPLAQLIEAAAILRCLTTRQRDLIDYLVRRQIPLPGDLPLANTWGNLTFLGKLQPYWLTKDTVDRERKRMKQEVSRLRGKESIIVHLPFHYTGKYGVSLQFVLGLLVSEVRIMLQD